MPHKPLPIGSKIGILGGGQLARMLCMAAAQLGFECYIYSAEKDCPAQQVATHTTYASYDDEEALAKFAQYMDVVTCEFENVSAQTLQSVGNLSSVYPDARAFALCQDRLDEKNFLEQAGLKVAPFFAISSLEELIEAVAQLGFKSILKTRRMGYDGKGQIALTEGMDLAQVWHDIGAVPCVLETKIDLKAEFSVVGVRNQQGEFAAYDVTRNEHKNHILHTSTVPSRLSDDLQKQALHWTQMIGKELNYCGVFAVEFFLSRMDGVDVILVNEIAPRVHNSGHWTMDGCACGQFENHIRAIAGWPLGGTARHSDVVMTNLLGTDIFKASELALNPQNCIHIYGKLHPRAGRKMGHITYLKPFLTNSLDRSVKNA